MDPMSYSVKNDYVRKRSEAYSSLYSATNFPVRSPRSMSKTVKN